MAFGDFTKWLFFGPKYGPKVILGDGKSYWMAHLQDVPVVATSSIVLFSQVDTVNESNNKSFGVIKQGQPVGTIVGCTESPGTFYLCVKNDYGTFFFEPIYITSAAISGALTVDQVAQQEKEFKESPLAFLAEFRQILWGATALASLYFLSKIFGKK